MKRTLAIIAAGGLTVAVVCIGAAAAIGTQGLHDGDFNFPLFGGPSCGHLDSGDGVANRDIATRDMKWDGSDRAILSIPGEARYAPGNDSLLHVSGNPALIAHVRVQDGHIELDCRRWYGGGQRIEVILPGRQFRRFGIAGSGKLVLDKLDQDNLRVSISGSGDVRGNGHVRQLDLHISGSGDADLAAVTADKATVRISGSGNADISPKDDAEVHISGSGTVNLHSYPARMDTHISGSGHIRNVGSGI